MQLAGVFFFVTAEWIRMEFTYLIFYPLKRVKIFTMFELELPWILHKGDRSLLRVKIFRKINFDAVLCVSCFEL